MRNFTECLFSQLILGDCFYLSYPLGFKFKIATKEEKQIQDMRHKDFVVLVTPDSGTFLANQRILKENMEKSS